MSAVTSRIYDDVLELEYDRDENSFNDEWGYHVDNIFEMLTPSDLFLFRHDFDYNTFEHRTMPSTVCIITIKGEDWNP